MVSLDEIDEEPECKDDNGSDAGSDASTRALPGAGGDLGSIMSAAAKLKMARLQERRRAWEEAPEVLRSTMARSTPPLTVAAAAPRPRR